MLCTITTQHPATIQINHERFSTYIWGKNCKYELFSLKLMIKNTTYVHCKLSPTKLSIIRPTDLRVHMFYISFLTMQA